jgi:hypothetical protein
MGVDEKSLGKGHNYLTLVHSLEAATAEHIEDDLRKESPPGSRREESALLRKKRLRAGRAWAIKESLRDLWTYQSPTRGLKHFESWHGWAIRSRLKSVKAKVYLSLLAKLSNQRWPEIKIRLASQASCPHD